MLAEIFMVRLEAAARRLGGTLPSSSSPFVPFNANNEFILKERRKLASCGSSADPTVPMIQPKKPDGEAR
jgi:hypothetical protein